MIHIRDATGADALAIRNVFLSTYGADYPDPHYYDVLTLTRMIYSDDALVLVAEDTASGEVVGTGSVLLDFGAHADLVGEFGRLAVHPDARDRRIGRRLLEERIRRVQGRLHVGVMEARVAHPFTLKIAEAQEFAAVGFLPRKMLLGRREDLALMARHFGEGLALRKNNPRIIPEAYPLAHLALTNCGLPLDAIVDEQSAPYPHGHGFEVRELTTEGYASLLRIERGRVRDREVFGPLSLHYGFFKLRARRSNYLLAREDGRVAGAVGFTVDPVAGVVSVFELIALHDHVIRFLLGELERRCREEWGAAYVEADVSAYAPRMQRTLLELSFLPAAYVPALVFDEVERLDVVKMVRLLAPLGSDLAALSPRARAVAEVVLDRFRGRSVLPRLAQAVGQAALFAGLEQEQVLRLAGTCSVKSFAPGEVIFRQGTADKEMYVLLGGEVVIEVGGAAGPVATVTAGECLGEMGLLSGACHSATATARGEVEAAVLGHQDLAELVRQRPDIAVLIYRNLAVDMGRKLRRSSLSLPPGR